MGREQLLVGEQQHTKDLSGRKDLIYCFSMKTQGYWASRGDQRPIARSGQPSNYYVAWLAILADEPGREEVTPFYQVSEDLCALSPFFDLISQVPPSLHGFSKNFHRYNHAAMTMNRFAHWIVTCYQHNFAGPIVSGLDSYIAKVIFLHAIPSANTLSLLRRAFRLQPIVLCKNSESLKACSEAGIPALKFDDMKAKDLMSEIGKLFSIPLHDLQKAGFSEDEMLPARMVADHPGAHNFGESKLTQYPTTSLRFLLPNETLINVIRRRGLPRASKRPPKRDKSVQLMLQSSFASFAHRLADYLLVEAQQRPDPTLDPQLQAAVTTYLQSSSPNDYDRLVSVAEQHLDTYARGESLILCCPAIHKESIEHVLSPKVPSRILKYLFKKKTEDYLTWIDPRDFRSTREQLLFMGLMHYAEMENAYFSSLLTLYSTAARWPVIRTPQLSSALFGHLRQVYQAHSSGTVSAVSNRIAAFDRTLKEEIPKEVIDFMAKHPCAHAKIFSDIPLEWLTLHGVPLMFQTVVSRIPLRPGNHAIIHFDESRDTLRFSRKEVEDVLIIDCTDDNDEVGRYSLILHDVISECGFKSRHRRVSTLQEYKDVLNEEAPHILVHWGHGSYDTRQDRGYLHIRKEKTEVWDWKGVAIPPIVLLAACETSALARTHNNPANAWIAFGARSVLATLLPVQADLTCTLFGRIFANLMESVSGTQVLENWSIVVSKTIILQRYLDFLYGYKEWRSKRRLPPVPQEFLLEYPYRWNKTVKSLVEGYRACTNLMREAFAFFGEEFATSFDSYLKLETVMPNTMFFTHLGSPETISLTKEHEENRASRAEEYWTRRDSESPNAPPARNSLDE